MICKGAGSVHHVCKWTRVSYTHQPNPYCTYKHRLSMSYTLLVVPTIKCWVALLVPLEYDDVLLNIASM